MRVIRYTQCYTRKSLNIANGIFRVDSLQADKIGIKIRSADFNAEYKDNITKEVMITFGKYWAKFNTEDPAPYLEDTKRYSLLYLLDAAHQHGINAFSIDDLRKCNEVITTNEFEIFKNVTFAEAAFMYETLFCDIDRSLYDKVLVRKIAGRKLDEMKCECKAAFLEERAKKNDEKRNACIDVNEWFRAEVKKLDKLAAQKKSAIRKELSKELQEFRKAFIKSQKA